MANYDGTELIGKDWDSEWDCMYLKEACDGAGKYLNLLIDWCLTPTLPVFHLYWGV